MQANMKSAEENPTIVDEYLANEVDWGRVVGPVSSHLGVKVQVNTFGVILKPHQPGKWI